MATKRTPGRFDCYAEAADDEPIFTLLARDRTAAGVVREWANRRALEGRTDPAKIADARACADAMDAWRADLEPVDIVHPID